MGFLDVLKKVGGFATKLLPIPGAGLIGDAIGAAGDMAAGGAQTAAHNRGTKLDAQLAEEQMNQSRQNSFLDQMMAREQDRRTSGNDAWKAAQQAQYVEGNKGYTPRAGLKSYGFGPKASTEPEIKVAQDRFLEANRRLDNQDSLTPGVADPGKFTLDPKNLNAGMWEKLGGILGPGLSTLGALGDRNGRMGDVAKQPTLTMEDLAKLGIYDEQI